MASRALYVNPDTGEVVAKNLNVSGTSTIVDTYTTVSSNISVMNLSGTGPALRVAQTGVGAGYPVADFYDNDVSTTVPALRIADGGNVGIGTDTPLEKLHVVGTVQATGFSGSGASLTTLDAGNVSSGTLAVARGGTGVANLTANKVLVGNGTLAVLQPTNLHWDDTNSRLGIGNANPNRPITLVADSTGISMHNTNVGINPSITNNSIWFYDNNTYPARVTGGHWANYGSFVDIHASTSDPSMRVIDGKVGIGTTNPQYKLHVNGTTNMVTLVSGASGTGATSINITGLDWTKYHMHQVVIQVVPSVSTDIALRTSFDNGSSYPSSGYEFSSMFLRKGSVPTIMEEADASFTTYGPRIAASAAINASCMTILNCSHTIGSRAPIMYDSTYTWAHIGVARIQGSFQNILNGAPTNFLIVSAAGTMNFRWKVYGYPI